MPVLQALDTSEQNNNDNDSANNESSQQAPSAPPQTQIIIQPKSALDPAFLRLYTAAFLFFLLIKTIVDFGFLIFLLSNPAQRSNPRFICLFVYAGILLLLDVFKACLPWSQCSEYWKFVLASFGIVISTLIAEVVLHAVAFVTISVVLYVDSSGKNPYGFVALFVPILIGYIVILGYYFLLFSVIGLCTACVRRRLKPVPAQQLLLPSQGGNEQILTNGRSDNVDTTIIIAAQIATEIL